MKITELKCPACGGDLKIDKDHKNFATCEYCNSSFALEWEQEKVIVLGQTGGGNGMPQKPAGNVPGGKGSNGKTVPAIIITVSLFLLLFIARVAFRLWRIGQYPPYRPYSESLPQLPATDSMVETEENPYFADEETEVPLSGIYAALAESIFGKPADEITDSELSRIQWLETAYDWDYLLVGYSFSNPLEDESAELTWLSFSRDGSGGTQSLRHFTGLKKLNVDGSLQAVDIEGLALESIGCYASSPEELAGLLGDTSAVKEIRLNGGVDSLNGLTDFPNLETFYVDGYELTDISPLAGQPALKSLTLESCDAVTDFSVLNVMHSLEELELDTENLKALNFLAGMENLKCLRIDEAAILTLDGLEERPELEILKVEDCSNLKNMSALENLTSLQELYIELPYDCQPPNLGRLTGLRRLELSNFDDCSFLSGMTELVSLRLSGCELGNGIPFSGLTKLEELSLGANIGLGQPTEFIADFPALQKLDLRGVITYDDISGILSIPTLAQLDISGMECEINFSKVKENPSLQELRMDGLKLYENVQVSGSNGFISVGWDDVTLSDHVDFLSCFPSLRTLSIGDNELTDIDFAQTLPALEQLDISGNFITDLKPLAGLANLKSVICTGNPISNDRVLNEKVAIINDSDASSGQ